MAKQPIGVTFTPKPGQPVTGVYELEGGVEVFETDAPYLLDDGKTLQEPLPVVLVDGPEYVDARGNRQSAFGVSGLEDTDT